LRKRCFEPSFNVAVDQRAPERQKDEDNRNQDATQNDENNGSAKAPGRLPTKKSFLLA